MNLFEKTYLNVISEMNGRNKSFSDINEFPKTINLPSKFIEKIFQDLCSFSVLKNKPSDYFEKLSLNSLIVCYYLINNFDFLKEYKDEIETILKNKNFFDSSNSDIIDYICNRIFKKIQNIENINKNTYLKIKANLIPIHWNEEFIKKLINYKLSPNVKYQYNLTVNNDLNLQRQKLIFMSNYPYLFENSEFNINWLKKELIKNGITEETIKKDLASDIPENIKALVQELENSSKTFKISDRDVEKMIDYIDKGTSPERLANSIKTVDKAVSRYIIATLLGYDNYAYSLKQKALELGVEPIELKKSLENAAIPEKYKELIKSKETGVGFFNKENAGTTYLPEKLRKWFYNNKVILNVSRITNSRILADRRQSDNGRLWVLGYDLKGHASWCKNFTGQFFDHSNEGGGSYGYEILLNDKEHNKFYSIIGPHSLNKIIEELEKWKSDCTI